MRIWSVSNQKGGVGKTTTAVALGGLLADRGQRVLIVDLDPHGSMTSYFRYDPDSIESSSYDLFMHKGEIPEGLPASVIKQTSSQNLDLMPASTALATLERQMTGQGGYGLVLAKSLALLWDRYDYALIDTPPLLGVLMVNAMAASEKLLIPVQTEFLALKGLERMVHTLTMVNRSRKRELPYLIVPTMFDRRTQAALMAMKTIRSQHAKHVWQAYIPVDTRLRDASRQGVTPSAFDPESRAVRAYQHLLKDLLMAAIAEPRTATG
ncbi:ParA family protein [Aestuariirhabdus litorea]|uniref:ParA family protein n=1 Tax=Aestuariirhabdus litorea TaxID=2528527 RepID=A0A3P3VR93_9GAMM|nr:ParA family protein [Aestuariirhabdus litorea]RRJ84974.1 ParA family protein [Aestuariirhabdus litorea]RWW98198.1 ParA family protein [Endozoicomonadaceae bacterium GTF-13]